MPRKPGFTLEQHKQFARDLVAVRAELYRLEAQLRSAYPVTLSRLVEKADVILGSIRSTLDDKICEEHPGSEEATRVYFGSGLEPGTRPG